MYGMFAVCPTLTLACSMAGEAAAYWRGLSAQALAAGAALPLRACRSVDLAGW